MQLRFFILIAFSLSVFLSLFAKSSAPPLSYPFRDISQPVVKDYRFQQIIILSTNRVGSTLVYMIFQYLFEDTLKDHEAFGKKVVKCHVLDPSSLLLRQPRTYFVIPVRNPIDAFCSLLKAFGVFDEKGVLKLLNEFVDYHLEFKKTIDVLNKRRSIFLRYEEFNERFDVIFDTLKQRFDIEISAEEKEKINIFFSKDAVTGYAKDFNSFYERDSVIGVHGNHISPDRRTLEELLPERTVIEIYRKLIPILNMYGY